MEYSEFLVFWPIFAAFYNFDLYAEPPLIAHVRVFFFSFDYFWQIFLEVEHYIPSFTRPAVVPFLICWNYLSFCQGQMYLFINSSPSVVPWGDACYRMTATQWAVWEDRGWIRLWEERLASTLPLSREHFARLLVFFLRNSCEKREAALSNKVQQEN